MPLSFNDFLKELAKAKPNAPVSKELNADQADDFFDTLNGIISFKRWKDSGLMINPVYSLDQSVRPFLDKNIQAFQQRLIRGEVRITRGPNGDWMPAPAYGELTENRGITSNPCTWYWKLKYYWWGVRLGLNHCATEWLSKGSGAATAAVSAFGLPGWIGAILTAIALTLKVFDKGCGVRIYITYSGQFWVTPRPSTVGYC